MCKTKTPKVEKVEVPEAPVSPPPPEPAAEAPVIGETAPRRKQNAAKRRGVSSLKIDLASNNKLPKGNGLAIPK